VLASALLFIPLLAASFLIGQNGSGAWSVALRLALLAATVPAVFALDLVTPRDLERLAAFPLQSDWMRRTRDLAVAMAGRVARLAARREAA
jgi:hypothetical protein